MVYDHRLPAELNPSGDLCVPLYIPHHVDYTSLILGVISQLENVEYYERDEDFGDDSAKIVAENWRQRTIARLVNDIATGAAFVKHSLGLIVLDGNKTRSSTTFAMVPSSEFVHSFTKKYAKISVSNMRVNHSVTNQSGLFRLALSAGGVMSEPEAVVSTTTARDLRAAATFGDIPVGDATISLQFATTGGGSTVTIFESGHMLLEIEEWD